MTDDQHAVIRDEVRGTIEDLVAGSHEERAKMGKKHALWGGSGLAGMAIFIWSQLATIQEEHRAGIETIRKELVELRLATDRNSRAQEQFTELRAALIAHDTQEGHDAVLREVALLVERFRGLDHRIQKLEEEPQ